MSYILSALKKAESERKGQQGEVSAYSGSSLQGGTTPAGFGRWALFVSALVVGVLVAVWWFYPSPRSGLGGGGNSIVEVSARTQEFAGISKARPKKIEPINVDTGNAFDSLSVSGHLYVATRPSLRKIVINGRTLREGGEIDGVLIEEITETGAIVSVGAVSKEILAY